MNLSGHSPLGHAVAYPDRCDPALLFPIPRARARAEIGLDDPALPFVGIDLWNAYELSWLDARGQPRVAIAELRVPADSPNLVESKSLKLYLNGCAHERFDRVENVRECIARDLSAVTDAQVEVALIEPRDFASLRIEQLSGASLDDLALDIADYGPPQTRHLRADTSASIEETLVTRVFRSNCPVTGQPDWASVQIRYCGPPIDHAGLLRYLVSYRNHAGFHEACAERIFVDVMQHCAPQALSVYARFTRRGGLDINPWRATPGFGTLPINTRDARQ